MPIISSIASRIFGLAVVLVFLMIVLVGFLLWQVAALNRELQTISINYEPLERSIVEINEAGLSRRLAFERWFGALVSNPPRTEAIADAEANYAEFTRKVETNTAASRALLDASPELVAARPELQQIQTTLEQVAGTVGIITNRQQEVLGFLKEGQIARAEDVLSVLDDLQRVLEDQRHRMQVSIDALVDQTTEDANRRHRKIVWTTIAATAASVLLGLSLAALVTHRLVQPVRSLMMGIRTVEKGDLSVELPVKSADEVGALTNAFNFFVTELRAKETMRSAFGKYIDPRILESVILQPGSGGADGVRQDMSVEFADLVGFTSIGEQLTPAGVVNLLNRHFTLQAGAIQQHHGVIDKFIGDAIMAFWGPPFTGADEHAALACRAALDQTRAIAELRELLPEVTGLRKNLPHLGLRIGISAGEVIVGNIGSENTRGYTVIGDTVNLASRLEQANRYYGTSILICENTRARAGDAITTREIDNIVVKGKTESTRIFELLGTGSDTGEDCRALADGFAEALAAYRARDWTRADSGFRGCLGRRADDMPSRIFLERIAAFRLKPPADDWDGAWVFDEK